MLRVRFYSHDNDPIAYADSEKYILDNWPDATDLDSDECEAHSFTDRFPEPEWFKKQRKAAEAARRETK